VLDAADVCLRNAGQLGELALGHAAFDASTSRDSVVACEC
jgi:hypothetical protein